MIQQVIFFLFLLFLLLQEELSSLKTRLRQQKSSTDAATAEQVSVYLFCILNKEKINRNHPDFYKMQGLILLIKEWNCLKNLCFAEKF